LFGLVRLDTTYATRFPHELSGGERQRVGVARALAARPDIVLMDEPFGALDPLTRDVLGQVYRRMHEDLGLTSVMITHDVLEALLLADRIVVCDHHAGEPEVLVHAPIVLPEHIAGEGIERAERLVHQHDVRARRERAGDAHPLALAA